MKQGSSSLKINIADNDAAYKRRPEIILCGIPILIGIWGMLELEWHISKIGADPFAGCAVSAAAFVCCAFFQRNKRSHRVVLITAAAAMAAYVLAVSLAFRPASAAWISQIQEWIFIHTGTYLMPFENAGDGRALLIPVAAGIAGLAALFQRVRPPFLSSIAAAALLILVLFGMADLSVFAGLIFAGSILSIALINPGGIKRPLMAAALVATVSLIAGAVIMQSAGTGESSSPGEIVKERFHKLRYETVENVLPEGKLQNIGSRKTAPAEVLKVTMSRWKALYLKSFTGGRYTGQGWEAVPAVEMLDEAALLYNLQSNYFFPSAQTGTAFEAAGERSDLTITVENTGTCRAYPAIPYGTVPDEKNALAAEKLTSEGISGGLELDNMTLYPVEDSYLLLEKINEKADEIPESYLSAEAAYRSYVHAHYLDIPDDTAKILKKCGLYGNEGVPTTQARAEIISLLAGHLTYDEEADTDNGSTDFLEYVLTRSKKGYDVHYATAAVMMLRSYGIPARYAEGYLLEKDEAESIKDGSSFGMTQENAHAWAEFYLDGVGWLPFDPTPGYTTQIKYALPAGDGIAQETPSKLTAGYQEPSEQDVDIESSQRQDINEGADAQIPWLLIILLCVIAFIVIMIIRAIIKRADLRRLKKLFEDNDPKIAAAALLVHSRKTLFCADLMDESQSISDARGSLAAELPGMDGPGADPAGAPGMVDGICELEREIWFSDHEINEEAKIYAGKWHDETLRTWKRKVSVPKRFLQRFVQCRVL